MVNQNPRFAPGSSRALMTIIRVCYWFRLGLRKRGSGILNSFFLAAKIAGEPQCRIEQPERAEEVHYLGFAGIQLNGTKRTREDEQGEWADKRFLNGGIESALALLNASEEMS